MIALLIAAVSLLAQEAQPAAAPKSADIIRVATFNIRLDTPKDGPNQWPHRKEFLFRTVGKMDPDAIGFQEVLAHQFDALKAAMPGYEFIGAGRNDGKQSGEFVPVAYKRERYEALAHGHFWLSETPEKPGSKSWDTAITRMATWVRLKDRASGRVVLFINTHFDHMGVVARAESGKLLRKRIDEMREGEIPVIVVGDFNTTEGSEPYANLRGKPDQPSHLADSFRQTHPERTREEGTFNGFKGERTGGRIDWILHTSDLKAQECEIVRDADDGRYPSDHFPVLAVLKAASQPAR